MSAEGESEQKEKVYLMNIHILE